MWEIFDQEAADYRRRLLPPDVPKFAIEAGVTRGWRDYVGADGAVIGLDRFGASAPGSVVMKNLGFSVENVVSRALELMGRRHEFAA